MVHNQKGYLLLEVLLTAGIILITLPIGFYGYKNLLQEKKLTYFTSELSSIIEQAQLRAVTHGSVINLLIDNAHHQVIVQEDMKDLMRYTFDSEINIVGRTHQLSFFILSNGHFNGAGEWEITLNNKSKWLIFNVGEGRIHVEK